MTRLRTLCVLLGAGLLVMGCEPGNSEPETTNGPERIVPVPEYFLSSEQTHNRFSAAIEPALRVPDGAVVEVHTKEASDDQLTPTSTVEDVRNLDFDPIHPLTGPVYVEGAEPGDVLAVTLHEIEVGAYGWSAIVPGFGFLADEFPEPYLKIFTFEKGQTAVEFAEGKIGRAHV